MNSVLMTQPRSQQIPPPDFQTKHLGTTVGVIGLGHQGPKLARYINNLGYRIIAACDLDPTKLEPFSREHAGVLTTTDVTALVHANPEIWIIATLAPSHAALIETLVDFGVDRILCEKPITNSIKDYHKIRRLLADKDVHLGVNHTRFYSPDYLAINELLEESQIGALREVKVVFKPGGFGNMGSHFLSLVQYLVRRSISQVEAAQFDISNSLSRDVGLVDPNGKAVFRMDGDVVLDVSNLPDDYPGRATVNLVYTACTIQVVEDDKTTIIFNDSRMKTRQLPFKNPHSSVATRYRCIDNALGELLRVSPFDSFTPACGAVEAVIAAQLAYRRGRQVTLPLQPHETTPYPFS